MYDTSDRASHDPRIIASHPICEVAVHRGLDCRRGGDDLPRGVAVGTLFSWVCGLPNRSAAPSAARDRLTFATPERVR